MHSQNYQKQIFLVKKTIKLGADITVNTGKSSDWAEKAPDISWTPIGRSNAFAGTFNGQGHTFSGLHSS